MAIKHIAKLFAYIRLISVIDDSQFTHSPKDIIEQFVSQPSSFVNFLEENYLAHFACAEHASKAASALSDADLMLTEWKVKCFYKLDEIKRTVLALCHTDVTAPFACRLNNL